MAIKVKGSGEVAVELSRDFYDIRSIKRGVKDFSGLCSATINEGEGFEVILKGKGKLDARTLGYEFCNYVLALMKSENIV